MRKILFALPLTLMFACSGNAEKTKETSNTKDAIVAADAKKYACPMQCEQDKTYEKEGKCPVCNMDLQEVALAETDSTAHTH